MISLYDILEAANGQLFGEPAAQIFTDFSIDPYSVSESQMFIALKTDRGDTHQYIEEAVKSGASGILCTRPPDCDTEGVSVLMVRDTVDALLAWAHSVLGKFGTKVIAVTGTAGKAITAQSINRVLSSKYKVYHRSVDIDGLLGIPMSLARLKTDHEVVILRLGSSQPGEIAEMVQSIQPDVGIVTNVDYAHTDTFESLDEIAQEKGVLAEYLSPTGLLILNYDDDRVREMANRTRARITTMSLERFGADFMAFNIVVGLNGTGFDLRYGSERHVARWSPLLGKHHLYAVLAALAVGLEFDIPLTEALKILTEIAPLPGRMNPLIGLNNCLLIDDSHSANPTSTLALLDWMNAIKDTGHRTIFVMGNMDGLGEYSQFGHRLIGRRAADVADLIVTEGLEAALVARSALDEGKDASKVVTLYSTQDTITTLRDQLQLNEQDIVLVKGGETSRMENVVAALLNDEADQKHLVRQNLDAEPVRRLTHVRPSWVEIDTSALANNVQLIKQHIGADVALMAVVKADGYGHGAVAVSQTAMHNGADYLAVASFSEAIELRDAGIDAPILVMSYTPVMAIRQAIRHGITISVFDLDTAKAYERAAREVKGTLQVHIKIDSGMGRLGVMSDDAISFFRHISTMQNLEIEGLYTHLSSAGDDEEYTNEQLEVFKSAIRPLRASGFQFKYIHAANSAGIFASDENHFTMVRAGIALYGLTPTHAITLPDGMKPVMTWKTVVIQVRDFPPNYPVGYGNTYHTSGHERIAILPVGYADGLRRAPQTWQYVLIHGQRAPLVGRVSMEKCAVNVTDIPGVGTGDEVVLLGTQGDETITADDVAEWLGTINYEVVTTILARVPRR